MKIKSLLLFLAAFLLGTSMSSSVLPSEDIISFSTESWTEICSDVTATVYNATKAQCNNDPSHTASNMFIDRSRVQDYRIIAMERTMMAQYGLHYGQVVKITGTGSYDGYYQIQDTMSKKYKGQHRIDFLVPAHITRGKWHNVTISIPANQRTRNKYHRIATEQWC